MEADSIHSTIERKFHNKQEIYIPANYLHVFRAARENPSPYNVTSLSVNDFRSYEKLQYSIIRPGRKKGDPCVNDICALQYTPAGIINYKLNLSNEWQAMPHHPKHFTPPFTHPPLYTEVSN